MRLLTIAFSAVAVGGAMLLMGPLVSEQFVVATDSAPAATPLQPIYEHSVASPMELVQTDPVYEAPELGQPRSLQSFQNEQPDPMGADTPRNDMAQQQVPRSDRCFIPTGICYLPDPEPIGSVCVCQGVVGQVVP